MTIDLVFANAHVHVSSSETVDGWLAVSDGRVHEVGTGPEPGARERVDCGGRHLLPGMVDIHTHFRDPGDTEKEDFTTGSTAAAFGGITTVVDMPNTGHLVVSPDDFREKRDYLADRSYVDYGLHALLADSAEHVEELRELGVAGLKWLMGYDFWKGLKCQPTSNAELRRTLIAAAASDVLVGVHAESIPWMHDFKAALHAAGRDDLMAHPESRPPFVEAIAVAEACIATAEYGCRLHIHHLTCAKALATALALRDALGTRLTIETCPSYLFLTENDVLEKGQIIQVNPPMRAQSDQDALWDGIHRHEIDVVATDHAPHRAEDKALDNVWEIPPGVLGVETTLSLFLHEAIEGRITLGRLIELLAERPAEIVRLGHRKGSLAPGHDADVVVVDLEGTRTISSQALHSKLKFTPYDGLERKGSIESVYLRGRPLVVGGELQTDAPFGTHVPSSYADATLAPEATRPLAVVQD